jgi:hypothetical protein
MVAAIIDNLLELARLLFQVKDAALAIQEECIVIVRIGQIGIVIAQIITHKNT